MQRPNRLVAVKVLLMFVSMLRISGNSSGRCGLGLVLSLVKSSDVVFTSVATSISEVLRWLTWNLTLKGVL